MSVTIPLRSDLPFFDLQVPLEGVTYTLQFRWNVRASAWFMDVLDEAGETVYMAGVRLVVNFPLGAYHTARNPPGLFVALDTAALDAVQATARDPGISDLGERVQLRYYTTAELP